ncbi:MAG TPA: beta-hydroxyacyl-ACP dehydratase [Fibrobacteria bacterium]|nr:beta-hydroxyacyl-ACP dehydratase [Fibrobacteria bacterium]
MHEDFDIPGFMAQRYPILLIDRIDRADDAEVRARKNITYNEPCYADMAGETRAEAFAYPCSLIIESFSQSVGVLLQKAWAQSARSPDHVVMFGSIGGFRFLGEAFPGDVLEHAARLDRRTEDTAIISGEVRCGGRILATVERIIAVVRPVASLQTTTA